VAATDWRCRPERGGSGGSSRPCSSSHPTWGRAISQQTSARSRYDLRKWQDLDFPKFSGAVSGHSVITPDVRSVGRRASKAVPEAAPGEALPPTARNRRSSAHATLEQTWRRWRERTARRVRPGSVPQKVSPSPRDVCQLQRARKSNFSGAAEQPRAPRSVRRVRHPAHPQRETSCAAGERNSLARDSLLGLPTQQTSRARARARLERFIGRACVATGLPTEACSFPAGIRQPARSCTARGRAQSYCPPMAGRDLG
jgi:hypothetical protein